MDTIYNLIHIKGDFTVFIPNAFTPNGDGLNDVFRGLPIGLQEFNYIKVFNRWGEQIFMTKDINIGWDGTRQTTGEQLPEGAYVYEIKGFNAGGNPIFAKGIINLIR